MRNCPILTLPASAWRKLNQWNQNQVQHTLHDSVTVEYHSLIWTLQFFRPNACVASCENWSKLNLLNNMKCDDIWMPECECVLNALFLIKLRKASFLIVSSLHQYKDTLIHRISQKRKVNCFVDGNMASQSEASLLEYTHTGACNYSLVTAAHMFWCRNRCVHKSFLRLLWHIQIICHKLNFCY